MNAERRKSREEPTEEVQYTYETVPGDSLPLIAELCGHSGEWTAIMDVNPYLWDLDWNNIQPGMNILLPPNWQMDGPEIEVEQELATTSSTKTGSSSVEETVKTVEDFESRH